MMRNVNCRIITVLIVHVIIVLTITACATTFDKIPIQDAASSHIAVLSVAPWDKYQDELMPNFEIDSKKALELVMPTTGTMDSRILDSTAGGMNIGFPSTTETPTKKSDDKSDIKTSGTDKNTGDKPEQSTPKILTEVKLEVDPILRYIAATALYQEVKMLNRYMEDAESCRDFEAYVVRLQISVMPKVREVPYDYYINLSFFNTDSNTDDANDHNVKIIPLLVTDNLENILSFKSTERLREVAAYLSLMVKGVGLGATFQEKYDNLQKLFGKDFNSIMTVGRISDNTVRVRIGALKQVENQYSLIPRTHNVTFLLLTPKDIDKIQIVSKSEMIHATNVRKKIRPRKPDELNASLDKIIRYHDFLRKIEELNIDDKVLADHINIKPTDKKRVKEDINDLLKCNEVFYKDYTSEERIYKCFGKNHKFLRDYLRKVVARLVDYTDDNDRRKFKELSEKFCYFPGDDYIDPLWADLVSTIVEGSIWRYINFDLPRQQFQLPNQTALLQDDGEKNSTILLQGENLSSECIRNAILKMQQKRQAKENDNPSTKGKKGGEPDEKFTDIPFIPHNIEILSGRRVAKLTFPSMKVLGLGKGIHRLQIETCDKDKRCETKEFVVMHLEKPKLKEPSGYSIIVTSAYIKADMQGKGNVKVIFRKTKRTHARRSFLKSAVRKSQVFQTPTTYMGKIKMEICMSIRMVH